MSEITQPGIENPVDYRQLREAVGSLATKGSEQGEDREFVPINVVIDHEQLAEVELPEEMDWVRDLPETLNIDEPITLIVGENASGKTQFSRALLRRISIDREGNDIRSREMTLSDDEPSKHIAGAIRLQEPRRGNIICNFLEGQLIMSKAREDQDESRDGAEHRRMSSRQVFDHAIQIIKKLYIDEHRDVISSEDREVLQHPLMQASGKRIIKGTGGEIVTVYDEPEAGLSPQRQLELEGILEDFADSPDHSLIVPTNNLALFLSDMPRIDTSKPERGVFRPSEYGEYGKIEFHESS